MMKRYLLCSLLAFMCPAAAISVVPASAVASAATTAKPYYTVAGSTIGVLLDNPQTKAVLMKYIADVIDNPKIKMARSLTLKQLQGFSSGKISDDELARIDEEIRQIPAPKP
jgi:hypothetical protein